jgi:hypothetical protein
VTKYKLTDQEQLALMTEQIALGAELGRLSSHYSVENCPPCAACGKHTHGVVRLAEKGPNVGSLCETCYSRIKQEQP